MAESGSDEVVDKIVCGLCSGKYKQPKLLPCFHSYCLECLKKYVEKNVRNNNFDCPLCDTTTEVPEGGVTQFERNIFLGSKFSSTNGEKHDCDLCGPEVNAVNHCTECEESYCERCSEIHMKQKATRMHTLLSLSDSRTGGAIPIKKKAFCKNIQMMKSELYAKNVRKCCVLCAN